MMCATRTGLPLVAGLKPPGWIHMQCVVLGHTCAAGYYKFRVITFTLTDIG